MEVPITFVIAAQSNKDIATALAYKITLNRGSIFKVMVDKNADSGLVFIDLFGFGIDTTFLPKPLVSNEWKTDSINYTV